MSIRGRYTIFIEKEISSSGCCVRYRAMHQTCIRNDYKVRKENIRAIVKTINLDGVELRKKQTFRSRKYFLRGPNCAWHIDGYDKIKPYDFPEHSCIDGYSRCILWFLSIVSSNNNPDIVGKLCLDYVKFVRRAPKKINGD